MAQRDDELTRTGTRWWERRWGTITKVTLGYGYQPWRALLFLAGVVAISCLLAVALGSYGALAQTSNTATPGRPCSVIQKVSVGLDLSLPIGTSVPQAGCDLTPHSARITAACLTAAGWTLRLLAWAFAAPFVAAFVTPPDAVLTSATEPSPSPPFTAVWSVVSADFSALIWVLNAPCASPVSAVRLACASFRSAFACFSAPVPPLTCARLASDACRAA